MTLLSTTDRALQTRRVWLAPICLCLVAALHLWRVTTAGQTPWKGGGFGMFSTIDAEHARFVRAYLLTIGGERPLLIPADLEKKVAELRAAPNPAGLAELAEKLVKRQWADPRVTQQRIAEQLQNEPASSPLTGERWRELRDEGRTSKREPDVSAHVGLTPRRSPSSASALPANSHETGIPFTAIRVELCKFEMPAGTSLLQTKRLLTITREASEGKK